MKWKLVSELGALVDNQSNNVWLYMDCKKTYKASLYKKIKDSTGENNLVLDETDLESNEFQLKFDNELHIYIKSEELPKKDEWYILQNFAKDPRYIGSILSGCTIKNGEVDGSVVFEAAFCDSLPGEVVLACSSMKEYGEYLDEMSREVNCRLYKKTSCSKWIPGHMYYSEKQTYYYLGEVLTRRISDLDSELLDPVDYEKGYLVISSIDKDVDKTVEDVLKNHVLGQCTCEDENKIQVLVSPKPMVDGGEALKPIENFDITKYWSLMIENAVNKSKVLYGDGQWKDYTDLFSIYCPLSLMSSNTKDYSNLNEYVVDLLKDVLHTTMLNTIISTNSVQKGVTMFNITPDSTGSDAVLVNDVIDSYFINTVNDYNVNRVHYYTNLFNEIGIDVTKLTAEIIDTYSDETVVFRDLDSMYKYIDIYNKYHFYYENEVFDQIDKSSKFSRNNPVPLTSKLSKDIAQTISDIVDKARDCFGTCVSEYRIENNGTTRTPLEYEFFKITLSDVVNYYNGVSNVPKSLNDELVACRFREVILRTDRGSKVLI